MKVREDLRRGSGGERAETDGAVQTSLEADHELL